MTRISTKFPSSTLDSTSYNWLVSVTQRILAPKSNRYLTDISYGSGKGRVAEYARVNCGVGRLQSEVGH